MNLQKGKPQGTHSTQQPRAQFNQRVPQAVQVSRQDDYIRQGPGYNSQAVPNPTGLYVSPAGGVAGGPGPQQAPPPPQAVAMPGTTTAHPNPQAAAPQQTGVIPGQMQQQRNQGLYFRQNVVRPFPNIGWPSNPISIPNSAPQVNASGFQSGAVPNVAYFQPTTAAYGIPQATIMRGGPVGVQTYQFPTAPAPGQYNIPQSQQLYLSTAGNTSYPPYGGQRPVYYNHMPQVITQMTSNRNSMPTLPPQQTAQQPIPVATQKRERKPLRIQDPFTLEDINLSGDQEFADHSAPDPSMSKEGSQSDPVPAEQADPRIQFAKLVAAAAIPGPPRKEPHKQECLAAPQGPPIIPPILPVALGQGMLVPPPVPPEVLLEASERGPVVMAIDPQTDVVNNEEMVEEVHEYELGTPMPPHEVMGAHDVHVMDSIEGLEEEEPYSTEDCLEEVPFQPEEAEDFEVEDVCEVSEEVEEPVSEPVGRTCSPSPPSYQHGEVAMPPASVLPTPVVATVTTSHNLPVENDVPVELAQPSLPAPPAASLSSPPRDSPTPESEEFVQEEKKVEHQSKPQQNGDLGSSVYDSKDALEGRDNKRKGKKKLRELNKKGEGKEGSEMDAFVVDRVEDLSNTNQAPPFVTTKVVLSSPDRETDDEELRKVAEKNQENTRVSGQDDDVPVTPIIEPPQAKPQSMLKYDYKEDQWSPLNPEGKKHYDRAFLLKMQSQPMSLKKPKGLPNLEVIKDNAMQFKLPEHGNRPAQPPLQAVHRSNQPDFMPSYARGGTPRPPQSGVNRRQSQQGRDKPKKIINISTSLTEDVKLHSSENAWKPTYKAPQETDIQEEAKTADLYKKVRGILNKLTPQKFQTLVEQVKDMPIDTEERLKGVIDLVFEKAVDEPNFSVPYANMCKHLAMKAVPSDQSNQNVNFRKFLLTKCQKEFESDSREEIRRTERLQEISSADPDKKKQMIEELEDELRKSRRRSLGNIKFIGELYKLNMLVTPIMHDCLKKLLKAEDEDSLECLCRLLTTVGKELETDKKPDASDKRAQNKAMMDVYFDGMKKVVNCRNTSSRVRFMIQDVIELRLNNWVPRRIENNPKTIDQIHMEAEREAQEQHLMIQQPLPPSASKRPDDRDRRKNRSMQGGGFEEGGWNTVGNKGRSSASFNYDPSKGTPKLVSKPLETDSIQLGPSNRTWSRGSSGGGARATTQDSDSKSNMPANRFQALASQDSEPRSAFHQSSSSSREPSRGRGSQGGGGPPMTLRKTPSQSNQSSSEREKMTAMVKAFFDPSSAEHTNSSNRNTAPEPNQESPDAKEVIPPSAPVPVAPLVASDSTSKVQINTGGNQNEYQLMGQDKDIDDMTKEAIPIIDEYLFNNDLKEAIQCIVELASPTSIDLFVSVSVNHVLERSNKTRIGLGQLLKELLAKKILNQEQLFRGLESIFASVVDLEIDIPKVWQYLGEILFPLVQDGSLSLAQLQKATSLCNQQNCGGKMFSNLLHVMAEHLGPNKIRELWEKSGLQWTDILSADEDPVQFVTSNKLEFTIGAPAPAPVEEFTMEQIKSGLDALLKKEASNENIFDWIEGKLDREMVSHPSFIRALVTSITESAIEEGSPDKVDIKKLKDRTMVLSKYIENKEHLELQALFAVQALDTRLQHPKNMLAHIFDYLYDEDVISEDGFDQWERNTDPAESEGKGVALKSLTSFFTWLKEADDESVEDN